MSYGLLLAQRAPKPRLPTSGDWPFLAEVESVLRRRHIRARPSFNTGDSHDLLVALIEASHIASGTYHVDLVPTDTKASRFAVFLPFKSSTPKHSFGSCGNGSTRSSGRMVLAASPPA